MNKDDLIKELQKHPEREAIAAKILGKEAEAWLKYRRINEAARLVDPKSGKWVREFTANKTKYFIRMPEDGTSLLRYSKLKQMLSIVGYDATYIDQAAALDRMNEAANSLVTKEPKLDRLFLEINNMKGAIRKTDRNWDFSFYNATLFIIRDGENIQEWSEADAEKKIEDWNKTKIHPMDFFLLVMLWASLLAQEYNKSSAIVQRIIKRFSPGT